jgi:hypothetical protein
MCEEDRARDAKRVDRGRRGGRHTLANGDVETLEPLYELLYTY